MSALANKQRPSSQEDNDSSPEQPAIVIAADVDDDEDDGDTDDDYVENGFLSHSNNSRRRDHTSGCCCCCPSRIYHTFNNKLWHNENGGDFQKRLEGALRAGLASGSFFSAFVFSGETALPSIWLGNLFIHLTLGKGTLGATVPLVMNVTRDLILTLAISWVVNLILLNLGSRTASLVLLPFVVGFLTFVIMSSPHLSTKNYMVVIMWIIVQLDLQTEPQSDEPTTVIGFMGTCMAGFAFGLLFILLPLPRPAMASNSEKELLQNIGQDTQLFLHGIKNVWLNAGHSSSAARRAIGVVELATDRLGRSVKELKATAPSIEVERGLLNAFRCCICHKAPAACSIVQWSTFIQSQQIYIELMRMAVTQRLLEGGFTAYNEHLREAKISLANNLKESFDSLVVSIIKAMDVGTSLTSVAKGGVTHEEKDVKDDHLENINKALTETRLAWSIALPEAESIMLKADDTNVPSLAFFVRRMQLVYGIVYFARHLVSYLEKEASSSMEKQATKCSFKNAWQAIRDFVVQPWPTFNGKNYRLPLKAAIGMMVASCWVVVPFLYERSQPFEYWPGITVASVNLATTGDSYQKCSQRLWATLLASAYALLIQYFVGEDIFLKDYVKVPTLAFFTFVAIYFRNPDRPYPSTYAAISIGSILYGSIANENDIEGYVSNRIVLIVIGILIAVVIEFLLFPQSARKSIQENSKRFLGKTKVYMKQSLETVNELESWLIRNPGESGDEQTEEAVKMEDEELLPSILDLVKCQKDTETLASTMMNDLQPALNEPVIGFSLPLNRAAWTELVKAESRCNQQMKILVETFKSLSELYSLSDDLRDGDAIRCFQWPALYRDMINEVITQLEECCNRLDDAFPDGRIRPQGRNSIVANKAASAFRDFEDVRLNILAIWSRRYRLFLQRKSFRADTSEASHDESHDSWLASLRIMIRLGLIASFLLEISWLLQKIGLSLEAITREFPSQSDRVNEIDTILKSLVPSNQEKTVRRQSRWISTYE